VTGSVSALQEKGKAGEEEGDPDSGGLMMWKTI
jgi:hypothetical protein